MYKKKDEDNKATFGYDKERDEITFVTISGVRCSRPILPGMVKFFMKRRMEERELMAMIAYMRGVQDDLTLSSESRVQRFVRLTNELQNHLGIDGPQLYLFDNLDMQEDFLVMTKKEFMAKWDISGMMYACTVEKKKTWLKDRARYEREKRERNEQDGKHNH